ncbi:hypothetical protein BH20ACT13_BH20ACT13_14860 [soil metagenome]
MTMAERRRERKVVTVVFCDLVGFTSQAESMDPEDVEALLRPYHTRVRAELERHGGTVEKFIGDAVMALFGAPTAHEATPSGRFAQPSRSATSRSRTSSSFASGLRPARRSSLSMRALRRAREWPRVTS